MEPFLQQVAQHYLAAPDIGQTCFVFPNRRSMVFFRKYLAEGLQRPMPSPPMFPVNDFFRLLSPAALTLADPLRLQQELYQAYKAVNPKAEPQDEFIFWGEVILQDFDDIDKYHVNPEALFRNVGELRAIQDDYSYLSDNQRQAVQQFLSHFKQADTGSITRRFAGIWNLLLPLYKQFRARLTAKGLAYEGMLYRALADALKEGASVADFLERAFPEDTPARCVFVGLNALNNCEWLLLKRLRDASLAEFVWDYVSPELHNPEGRASVFMRKNVADFPQAFPIKGGSERPQVTVISVPSGVGQAKLAPWILSQVQGKPVETAFVLPDAALLQPLLNSLPPENDAVNVTMGCPMNSSATYNLLCNLGQLQLHLRRREEGWYAYHRQVREVFSSGLFRQLLSPEEAAIVDAVKQAAQYYVPLQQLKGGPVLDLFFQPVVTDPLAASARQNHALEAYFSEIVGLIGRSISHSQQMLLELDFAKRCHTALNILQETDLDIKSATHLSIVQRSLEGISVPFRGEPLQGLQIMGPLETRALDFRNLVILSMNEGSFPRRSQRPSFVPPELRRGFGLPTYDYQDAVWAYYFYRLLQRPEKVWLICDSRTEGLRSGEESRFIKQLEYLFGWPVQRMTASASLKAIAPEADIPKTPEAIERIREKALSASVLQSYLSCPAKFYYQVVEGLRDEEEIAESLDARMLGIVFHNVMQRLYGTKQQFTGAEIEALEKDGTNLRRMIREEILDQMHSIEISGRNLVLEQVLLDYVVRTLQHDSKIIGTAPLQILGLERKLYADFEGFSFKGTLDRLDSYRPGELRIIDYKTGMVKDEEMDTSDANAAKVVEKLFGPVNKGRPKIALQLFLYDYLVQQQPQWKGLHLLNSIYATGRLYTGALPEVAVSEEFARLTKERLKDLLEEIVNPAIPFHRTTQVADTCAYCDFKMLCGR